MYGLGLRVQVSGLRGVEYQGLGLRGAGVCGIRGPACGTGKRVNMRFRPFYSVWFMGYGLWFMVYGS